MFFLSCDYHEDPKVPPTEFTVTNYGKPVLTIKVADYSSLQDTWVALEKAIVEKGIESLQCSSIVDYLFMDGLLEEK